MTPTDDEILEALGDDELTGFQITRRVETRWREQGQREWLILWPRIPPSTLYRRLDQMQERGLIYECDRRESDDGSLPSSWYRRRVPPQRSYLDPTMLNPVVKGKILKPDQ